MIRVLLERGPSTDEGTFGKLTVGKFECTTGELPDRHNFPDISCIPTGVYVCTLAPSLRFKRKLYHVQEVPKRQGILIHSGNLCGNVEAGYVSQVEGCILLGSHVGLFRAGEHPAGAKDQRGITNSVATVEAFMREMGGEDFELEIVGPKGDPGGF